MKKFIGLFSLAVVFTAISCGNQPAEVKKEIIVVPSSPVTVPSTPVIIVKDPPVKSTTIVLDKKGVKVETKKIDVVIKKQ